MGVNILIIEDNPTNLELMTYLLNAFGHRVLAANTGIQGLETAKRERPDLIICDVQLPDISGCEVARWLKSEPELRHIPLVAVTALAMLGDRERMIAAGFDGYLAKPIDPETFVGKMEAFLGHSQMAMSSPSVLMAHPAPPGSNRFISYTILVVDNLLINLELARSVLEPFGYSVVTAECIVEALEVVRRVRCDLILSDVCMAKGSGYDLIREVKADRDLCGIPFVFITSTMVGEKDRRRGLEAGAVRFLIRPIEPETLLTEIRQCLSRKANA